MSDCGEQQSLLHKDMKDRGGSRSKSNCNRSNNRPYVQNLTYLDEEIWNDSDSSSCSSYYSDCYSSSIIEWESEISPQGELFYVESIKQPKSDKSIEVENNSLKDDSKSGSTEASKRKTTAKGKLVRLIRRRSSRRSTRKRMTDTTRDEAETSNSKSGSKVTFRESQEGESREVVLRVVCEGSSLGRRATPAESLLGLALSTFSDKTRVMVAGFVPNSQASRMRNIKVGDWLKNINGEEVNNETMNSVLSKIIPPCDVTLKLQRVAECDSTQPTSTPQHLSQNKVTVEQSELVRLVLSSCERSLSAESACGVLYASQDGEEGEGPLYSFPRQDNILSSARGAFLTLSHLVTELTQSPPLSTTLKFKEQLIHIIYTCEENELFLLAVPNSRCTLREAELLNNDIVRSLKFTYQTLSRCFNNKVNDSALDRMFSLLQTQFIESSTIALQRFEDLLPAAHLVALPRDAQVQIDDALSELESNDFGGFNDDDDCQRLYSIIGSCLFYKGYLLASHLSREDLMDVNAYFRHNGLLSLTRAESVKSVVVWKEVFPASTNRGLPAQNLPYFMPQGRWFLAIVGQEESLLALLLESGGCTVGIEGSPGPEPIYIKQAQATLQHMKEIEVLSLAGKWIANQCRVQTVSTEVQSKSSVRVSTDNNTSDLSPKSTPSPSTNKKSQEVTSILKHASSPDESFVNSGQSSEDSVSQTASQSSVVSDEAPILGRRAERERERASDSNSHSRLSDSDFSDDSDWASYKDSYHGNRLFDLCDLGKTLRSDIEYSLMRLTAGDQDTLFYYCHLDCTEGVVMCRPADSVSGRLQLILDNFRAMAPVIHNLLQNTVRFKKLRAQEVPESLINKSLIANKEHAMLFECPPAKTDISKKSVPLTYWVVGRLFFMPQPREVYVCYQDSSPQNLVEIAFRLALSASG